MKLPPNLIAGNVFYYYKDLARAEHFYTNMLGFELAADFEYAKILQVAANSYLTLVDSAFGRHGSEEPKSVTLALVTDQLEAWHSYLKNKPVAFEKEFEIKAGSAHDGFVITDTEGYFLEFERFNPHPENESLLPELEKTPETQTALPGLAVQATVLWLYYPELAGVQSFYEGLLGQNLLVDQGWAKVYPLAGSSYIGLVDGRKGLHNATEQKSVIVSFLTDDIDEWFKHLQGKNDILAPEANIIEEAGRVRLFTGVDPGGYDLEWDEFLNKTANAALLEKL